MKNRFLVALIGILCAQQIQANIFLEKLKALQDIAIAHPREAAAISVVASLGLIKYGLIHPSKDIAIAEYLGNEYADGSKAQKLCVAKQERGMLKATLAGAVVASAIGAGTYYLLKSK